MRTWYWSNEERHRLGRNDLTSARREIVGKAFAKTGLPIEDAQLIADKYSAQKLENIELFPGSLETLHSIANKGLRLALVTNGESKTQRYKIKRFNLEKYFECILIEGELGFGKPDRIITEITELLQLLESMK